MLSILIAGGISLFVTLVGTPFFIILQGTAGTFGAASTGSLHPFSTILSVSCRQPLRTCARIKSAPRRIFCQKKTGS